jgi:hypothetical protein
MKFVRAMVLSLVAAPTVALAASAAAPPGWDFVKWGMTPTQLRAASHGTVHPDKSGDLDFLNGEYSIGTFKFTVEFGYSSRPDDPGNFAQDNLVFDGITMGLDLKSGTCAGLAAYLPRVFGKPDRTTTEGPQGYWWYKKDLAYDINYYSWPDKSCGIEYSPIGAS